MSIGQTRPAGAQAASSPQEKPHKEVAQKCLGQMGHARAAGALRACLEQEPEAAKESQLPVRANTRLGKCASF